MHVDRSSDRNRKNYGEDDRHHKGKDKERGSDTDRSNDRDRKDDGTYDRRNKEKDKFREFRYRKESGSSNGDRNDRSNQKDRNANWYDRDSDTPRFSTPKEIPQKSRANYEESIQSLFRFLFFSGNYFKNPL